MRWVSWLAVATLLASGGFAYAGPDEGGKGCGVSGGGGPCGGGEASQTVSDEPATNVQKATNVQMTVTDAGQGRQLTLVLSGPWNQIPEARRQHLLKKLSEMLPEETLKTVLKQLVAGGREINVAVATPRPATAAIPATPLVPARGGGAAGRVRVESDGEVAIAGRGTKPVPAGGAIRIVAEKDIEKLPPEVRKQIEEVEELREWFQGHAGRVEVVPGKGPRLPGQPCMPGGGRGRGGRGSCGEGRAFDGERRGGPCEGYGGPGGRTMRGGRGGQPRQGAGDPLLRAVEELTREIRGLRADLTNAHRPPPGPHDGPHMRGNFRLFGNGGEGRGWLVGPAGERLKIFLPEYQAAGDTAAREEELESEIEELEVELKKELKEIRENLKRIQKEIESLRSK